MPLFGSQLHNNYYRSYTSVQPIIATALCGQQLRGQSSCLGHHCSPEEVGHDIIRHDYHMTTHTYCIIIIACFRRYTLYILMYIKVSPHMYYYSVGAADISIEDYAVGSTVLILTVLFSYLEGNREIRLSKFQTAVSLQQPSGSTGFMQYSCSVQPELLKDMYILHALAMKMESRPESFPVHFP